MRRTIVRQTAAGALITALALALLIAYLVAVAPANPGARAQEGDTAPSVSVWPGVGELHSSSSFAIMGTGFAPGEEVRLLIQTSIGRGFTSVVTNDISENVDPPVLAADDAGNFAARFDMGRFERVMAEGIIGVTVADAHYAPMASAPVAMCDPAGRSRVGAYPRGAPDYAENPDDPRPSTYCAGFFEYPERPE